MTTGGDISTTAGWTGSVCGRFAANTLQPHRKKNIGSSHSNRFMAFISSFAIRIELECAAAQIAPPRCVLIGFTNSELP